MATSMKFSVLFKKVEGVWTGHCLELDIVAESSNFKEVQKEMGDLIMAQVDYAFSNDNLENLYNPAPPSVWIEYWKCEESHERKLKMRPAFSRGKFRPPAITANEALCGANN